MDSMTVKRAAPPPTPMERAVAVALNNARSARGMDIKQLAQRAGVDERTGKPVISRPQLSRVLDGTKTLRMGQLFALCGALGLEPTEVLRRAKGYEVGEG